VSDKSDIAASDVIGGLVGWCPTALILVEGGPRLLGAFLADHSLDELFLTVSPQVAGRDASVPRRGLVEGNHFGPADPRWSKLVSVRRGESHLFLRYAFDHPDA
jgi:riboflavin biosynthesis pyrimidine reductase